MVIKAVCMHLILQNQVENELSARVNSIRDTVADFVRNAELMDFANRNIYASGAVSFDSMIGVVIPSVSKGHSEIVFMDGYRPYAEFSWGYNGFQTDTNTIYITNTAGQTLNFIGSSVDDAVSKLRAGRPDFTFPTNVTAFPFIVDPINSKSKTKDAWSAVYSYPVLDAKGMFHVDLFASHGAYLRKRTGKANTTEADETIWGMSIDLNKLNQELAEGAPGATEHAFLMELSTGSLLASSLPLPLLVNETACCAKYATEQDPECSYLPECFLTNARESPNALVADAAKLAQSFYQDQARNSDKQMVLLGQASGTAKIDVACSPINQGNLRWVICFLFEASSAAVVNADTALKTTNPKATTPKATTPKATNPKATTPKATTPKATTPKACMCTKILKPVCGKDGKTYSNACLAKCAGVEVTADGPCKQKPKANAACLACQDKYCTNPKTQDRDAAITSQSIKHAGSVHMYLSLLICAVLWYL